MAELGPFGDTLTAAARWHSNAVKRNCGRNKRGARKKSGAPVILVVKLGRGSIGYAAARFMRCLSVRDAKRKEVSIRVHVVWVEIVDEKPVELR